MYCKSCGTKDDRKYNESGKITTSDLYCDYCRKNKIKKNTLSIIFCIGCGSELNGKSPNSYCCDSCKLDKYKFRNKIDRNDFIRENETGLKILYECKCRNEFKINHHFDYDRPKEIIKLCRSCHRIEHWRLRGKIETRFSKKISRGNRR